MKRIAILIALSMVSLYMYGRINSVWVIPKIIPMIFNDGDVDSIEYVMNSKGGYEQHLYSGDSVYVTQLTNDLVITFDKHGVNTEKEVDMGLPSGTIWAGYNLGASSPEEYGDYYCYGDTIARNVSGDTSFPMRIKDFLHIGAIEPGSERDVVTREWGQDWCMPEYKYVYELFRTQGDGSSCNWYYDANPERCADPSLAVFRGQNGMLITSRINGNRLFLPAAGAIYLYIEMENYPNGKKYLRLRDVDVVGAYLLNDTKSFSQVIYPFMIEFDFDFDFDYWSRDSFLRMGGMYFDAVPVRAIKPKPGGKFEFDD